MQERCMNKKRNGKCEAWEAKEKQSHAWRMNKKEAREGQQGVGNLEPCHFAPTAHSTQVAQPGIGINI